MRSRVIDDHLCKTVGGGRFVDIPGFPGEQIDRRLLADIRWMKRRFDIFITDGYSTDPVHARNGEHPIGLATDIVPNRAKGGTWRKIGALARKAEPRQDHPIAPWRWVGWNGDAGHGRGDHLHLSWMHSETEPKDPARVVYTRKCPEPPDEPPPPLPGEAENGRHLAVGRPATLLDRRDPRAPPAAKAPGEARAEGFREALSEQDRATRLRERSSGVPVVAGSSQANPRHMPATA